MSAAIKNQMNTVSKDQTGKLKYKEISNRIALLIDNGTYKYQQRLPSEAELCTQYNVSRQTIRNSLEELTVKGYINRVKGSGSYVKRQVRRREKSIGVLFCEVGDYINSNILNGLENVFSKNGYDIILKSSHNKIGNETLFLKQMLSSNVSGLIIEACKSNFPTPNVDLYQQLADEGIPYVFVNSYYHNLKAPAVVWDDYNVSYQLTTSLIDSGHQDISCLFMFDTLQGVMRYLGFVRAFIDHHLDVQENRIFWYSSIMQGDSSMVTNQSLDAFIDSVIKDCSAMLCYNDLAAIYVMKHFFNAGSPIPSNFSIMSFDNSDMLKLYGIDHVQSASHPKEKMGKCAAELLLKYIDNLEFNSSDPEIITIQ